MNVKKLGFGLARLPLTNPNDDSKIDIEMMKKMVDVFLERGFTYFDTAWMYHGYQSEKAVKEALVSRYPRDAFLLATKLPPFIREKQDRDRIFYEQLKKTGVDFFDYYLLHNIGTHYYRIYEQFDCFSWLKEKKKQGMVKKIGFSFHDDAKLLEKILKQYPDVDFVQLQVNYLDWDNESIQSRKCLEVAERYDIPVIVMEPVKGGTLAKVPKEVEEIFKSYHPDMSVASWAIRFAAGLDHVIMVLSGMSNMEQILDNTSYMMDFQPLTEEEQGVIRRAVEMICSNITIPCTGCSYCTVRCPMNIAIPKYFALYNAHKQETDGKRGTPYRDYYDNVTRVFGKASVCIACGQCETICPQHLRIISLLKKIAECYEK